ncbi:TetR/AcrR family transcriptional regulator [Desulfoscipio gibsoniae]|uniref:Transcriptional regulator n=1 Tax=Desulfoscipio gibsoniae DSM 7213 TaxID=767817 RepID=R4KSK9_9FIRM|nr:TetR/AcrR family transcriptional regulator [Desulfoscipio gibsoniae]AGL02571.1 transcriptional regulator [Desulfoscipio gibsoniae DSM 7213]
MAKFTESEKEQIRQCLLTKGKELFTQYGLAKTSIDDLVQACGIAKGSFYKFFSSKEELFYIILQNQEEVTGRLIGGHLRQNLPPKELISSFLHMAFQLADENPLLHQWFQDGESERIKRKLPQHLVKDFARENAQKGITFVQTLIQRGVLREADPEVINGVLHAILLLRLHKEELGKDLFLKIMDVIIDYIAEGLTNPE